MSVVTNSTTCRVRLSPSEISAIIDAACNSAASANLTSISIFGSRANLSAAGGDIDILIECAGSKVDKFNSVQAIRTALVQSLGEQKFDIFLYMLDRSQNTERENVFYDLVRPNAVKIWRTTDE